MKRGVNTDGGHAGNESLDEGFSLFGDRIALPPAQQNDRPRPCPVGVPSVATECFRLREGSRMEESTGSNQQSVGKVPPKMERRIGSARPPTLTPSTPLRPVGNRRSIQPTARRPRSHREVGPSGLTPRSRRPNAPQAAAGAAIRTPPIFNHTLRIQNPCAGDGQTEGKTTSSQHLPTN